jgi:methyl-accepting chemotaxis protein
MPSNWTFGRKIGLGFAFIVALTLVVGGIATFALQRVVLAKDQVLTISALSMVAVQRLEMAAEQRISSMRGFLITRSQSYVDEMIESRADSQRLLEQLRRGRPELDASVDAVQSADDEFRHAQEAILALARRDASKDALEQAFNNQLDEKRRQLQSAIDRLMATENAALERATNAATALASSAIVVVISIAALAALFALVVALALTRSLGKQIIAAVARVQSSSAELQATANQQAAGLREQATAMTEITTTISELLTTSRQIADGAQRVAAMALQTGGSARAGDETVTRAHESFAGIQRQVELIVGHMLDLGRKSQQIGTVLEIVSELAEQTNILAINATIEASGAGESGRRFAVVADEIRKLADRVSGSTKEIRALIDDMRSAVNTTVMATETGSKTVEIGSRQFGEVATSLRQIAGLVGTTTEAAREIELSTKQQSTAVEQVNVAMADVAQASKDSEASATQTLQTASHLASLSKVLLRVVQPEAA